MYMVQILDETGHAQGWLGNGRCKKLFANATRYHHPSGAQAAARGYWRRSPAARMLLWRTQFDYPKYLISEIQSEWA